MPAFCVYCKGSERKGDVVPRSLALNTWRVKGSENLRLHCCSATCPWREKPSIAPGTGGGDAADQLNPMSEIPAADRMDDDNTLDVAESDDEAMLTNPSTDAADGNASFRKDLFPFSRQIQ